MLPGSRSGILATGAVAGLLAMVFAAAMAAPHPTTASATPIRAERPADPPAGPVDLSGTTSGPELHPDLQTCPRADQRGEAIIDDYAPVPDLRHLTPVQVANAYLPYADGWTKQHADPALTTAEPDPTAPLLRRLVWLHNHEHQLIALLIAYNEGTAGWHVIHTYECD